MRFDIPIKATLRYIFFFFNDTPPPEIYPLPHHAALPFPACAASSGLCWPTTSLSAVSAACMPYRSSCNDGRTPLPLSPACSPPKSRCSTEPMRAARRSEEHTSELQSQSNLVCRLLLEKKN